jgi:hypothetical protein
MPRPIGPLVLRKTYDNQKYADALQQLVNRMSSLEHAQGPFEELYPIPHRAWQQINDRVELYLKTGDTQFLLDAANFALMEYLRPSIPSAFMRTQE